MPHGLGKHIAQRRRADVRTNGVKHCPPFAPSPERSGVDARLDQRYNRLRREKQQEIEPAYAALQRKKREASVQQPLRQEIDQQHRLPVFPQGNPGKVYPYGE